MAFHNKCLSENEQESFVSATEDFVKSTTLYHGKTSLVPFFWTVDEERKMCLIVQGSINRDEPHKKIIFFEMDSVLFYLMAENKCKDLTETCSIIYWRNLKVLASSSSTYNLDKLKRYVTEALMAYGYFGDEDIEEQFKGITVKYDIKF